MKASLVILLICVSFTVFVFSSLATDSLNGYKGLVARGFNFEVSDQVGPRRVLLSDSKKSDTALLAGLDGTIFLMEMDSWKPLWSFSSGSPIYSSYQAPAIEDNGNLSEAGSDYYFDCGDDWELYAYSRLGKWKLRNTLAEFVSSAPHVAEDGGILLGSKNSTVFVVDGKTGSVIHTYRMPDSATREEYNSGNTMVEELGISQADDLKADEQSLYITRTDYALTSFAPNSNKVLWNITVAEVVASRVCKEFKEPFDGALLSSGSSEPGFDMPLLCQSKAWVHRFRNHDLLETVSRHGLPEDSLEMGFPESTPYQMLDSQPHLDKSIEHNLFQKIQSLNSSQHKQNRSEERVERISWSSLFSERITASPLLAVTFVCILTYVLVRKFEQPNNTSLATVPFKRKKTRKSGKSGFNAEKRGKDDVPNGNCLDMNGDDDNFWLNFSGSFSGMDGRWIGKLFLTANEIAKGSNGTVVLEGIYDGRPVAVKRLVRAHHDIAFKEIQNLIASDRHPNIVRWFGVEQDQDFVYLLLERCVCSLNDLVHMFSDVSENLTLSKNLNDQDMAKYKIHMDSVKVFMQDTALWKANGYPSPILLKLLRDVVSGLVHLHELGIIHRDLKPQNVLIMKDNCFCAKLSDMGISKRLTGDMASLGQHATGYGSPGWQAPEQLLLGRQTRGVDLFSLGCVLFFCITGGRHPFGDHLERDVNIIKNQVDLFLVEHIPEAKQLFSRLLNPNPELRPTAVEVLAHPLFWNAELRLSFFRDTSDRVELEDRGNGSQLLKAVESTASVALGGKWDEKVNPVFLNNIGRYRRYKYDSVRDLLRVMRNKLNHYRELPTEIQEILGPIPEGFDNYFASRFPNLLIEVYKVMSMHCKDEECFRKYFKCSVL